MATNGAQRRVIGAASLVVGLMACADARAQERLVGYLEYQTRKESREGIGQFGTNAATLRVDGHTHVWEPWFASLSGGIGLTWRSTHQPDASQSGVDVSGSARLRLFPRSAFPLELFVDRTDTRTSGDLVGPDYAQTVVGLLQSYSTAAGTRYSVNFRHTDREDHRVDLTPSTTRTTDDFLTLTANRAFDHHQLDARVDHDRLVRDNPMRTDTRDVGLVRHRYTSDRALTIDTLASLVASRTDDVFDDARATSNQWNSNLFWRPATLRPVIVTGSFVMSGIETSSGAAVSDIRTTVGTAGVSWQYTPTLALRSSVNVARTETATDTSMSSLARVGANYSPLDIPWRAVSYRRAMSGDIGYRTDERTDLSVPEVAATASHGVSYATPFQGGSASAVATQMVTTLRSGTLQTDSRLTHSASLDWSVAQLATYGSLRLLATDTRRFEPEPSTFQLLNLQGSGRYQVNRLAGWQGSVTVQATRSESPQADVPWVTNTSASITYRHERVFGVPLLRFTSEWRALSDELAQSTRDGFSLDHRARWTWTNRLDYIVGRLQFSVRESVGEVDGRAQALVFFMVRRYFSQLPQ